MTDKTTGLTRRALLGVTAAAGAGVLIRPSAGAAAGWNAAQTGSGAQRVFARSVGVLRGESPPIQTSRRFVLAGAQWSAPVSATIELRTRRADGGWGPWALASVQGHEPDRPTKSPVRFGEPVWTGEADSIQLRSSRPVDGVRLHFVTPDAGAVLASAATFALAQPALDAGPGQPEIIARSAWAGRQAPPAGPANYGSIQLAFVHHTDNPNGYSAGEVPAMLLAIFDYHRYVRHFFDIAYNFIIDAFGRIWEARAGGIDEPVVGAQAGGFNQVSTGVAVLGTFMSSVPSDRALAALDRLLAWKLSLHGVPTLGKARVRVNPSDAFYTPFRPGQLVALPRVSGHRDGDLTDCPGNAFYARLPALRLRIAKLARSPARLTLTLTPATATVPAATGLVLRGRLKLLYGPPIAGTPVELQRLAADRASTIATATTDADGRWSITLPVSRAITLRALHRAAPAAASNVVSIAVRPVLTLSLESVSPPRVSGSITPAKATVTIDTYRVAGEHRRLLDSRRVRVRHGRFSARIPIGKQSRRRIVVVARAGPGGGTLAGESPPVSVDL
jgi:hypothetical protein